MNTKGEPFSLKKVFFISMTHSVLFCYIKSYHFCNVKKMGFDFGNGHHWYEKNSNWSLSKMFIKNEILNANKIVFGNHVGNHT